MPMHDWSQVRAGTYQTFELTRDRLLTIAAYQAAPNKTAYVEPIAVGSPLPTMPLFLLDDYYVELPLEVSYNETWNLLPKELKGYEVFATRWPPLPDEEIFQISPSEGQFAQLKRGFGEIVETMDPQQIVIDKLERLERHLNEQGILIEGMAFAHVE